MIDFAGKRWYYIAVSGVLFVIAAVCLGIWGLQPGIEFTSGSSFTFEFSDKTVSQQALRDELSTLGHSEARIQGAGSNTYLVRTSELQGAPPETSTDTGPVPTVSGEIDRIQSALCQKFGTPGEGEACTGVNRKDFSTVSSTVSSEIGRNATFAVIAAAIAILIYISISFRKLPRPYLYGASAIIAVLHDAFIVLGVFAILGEVRGTEVDTAFITAILTIIGFSVHDTIVVYDRIRETILHDPYIPFEEAVNASMTQTLARSINTSLVVVLTVVAMLLIGGSTIQNFLLVLLIGVISGTYSSIGIASQLLVAFEQNDFGRFWKRLRGRGSDAEVQPV